LGLVLVCAGLVSKSPLSFAAGNNTGPTPSRVYQRLLRALLNDNALPLGFYESSTVFYNPSPQAMSYHAVGGVEIDFDRGDATLMYLVFTTRADAVAYWNHAKLPIKRKSTLTAPKGFPRPALIANGSVKRQDPFGPVILGATDLAFISKFVVVQAFTYSTLASADKGDIPGAITLGRFGLAHLRAATR
jgi:hypothetical protein